MVLPYIIQCITRFVFPQPLSETFFCSSRLSITVSGKYLNTNLKFVLFIHSLWTTFGSRPPDPYLACLWPQKMVFQKFFISWGAAVLLVLPGGRWVRGDRKGERHGPRPDRHHHKGREKVCLRFLVYIPKMVLSNVNRQGHRTPEQCPRQCRQFGETLPYQVCRAASHN